MISAKIKKKRNSALQLAHDCLLALQKLDTSLVLAYIHSMLWVLHILGTGTIFSKLKINLNLLITSQNDYDVFYKSGEENIDVKQPLGDSTKPLKAWKLTYLMCYYLFVLYVASKRVWFHWCIDAFFKEFKAASSASFCMLCSLFFEYVFYS